MAQEGCAGGVRNLAMLPSESGGKCQKPKKNQKKRQKIWRLKIFAYLCTRIQDKSSTNDGAIAQLVEQRTENPCVPGSIPGGTT